MWFKNLQAYTIRKTEGLDLSVETLNERLCDKAFISCPRILPAYSGWVSSFPERDGAIIVEEYCGILLVTLKMEEKIIPASAVRYELSLKVDEIESREKRKLTGKEKLEIKEDVYSGMVVRAFSKSSVTRAMIDPVNMMMIVDAPSRNKAEDFCSTLRDALGTLVVFNPVDKGLAATMTQWLRSESLPPKFTFGEKCLVSGVDEFGTVRFDNQNILSDEIGAFLQGEEIVKNIQLGYSNEVSFVLKDDFSISNVKFSNEVVGEASNDSLIENAESDFHSILFIMSRISFDLIRDLISGLLEKS